MKEIIKKSWFWVIIIVVFLLLVKNHSFKQGVQDGINKSMGNETEQNSSFNNTINNVTDFNNTINNVTENSTNNNSTVSTMNPSLNSDCKLAFGELESFVINPDDTKKSCIIKAKIEPSYSNKATIHQNFYNVEDFIKNQNGNKYNEIQYWAVADMQSGEESKVISFTLDKNTINDLYNNKIVANMLDDYLTDYWIADSLK